MRCDDKPKRKPIEDGTLPLTDEEKKQFGDKFDYGIVKRIYVSNTAVFIIYERYSPFHDEVRQKSTYLDHTEIAWLAELFDLTGKK